METSAVKSAVKATVGTAAVTTGSTDTAGSAVTAGSADAENSSGAPAHDKHIIYVSGNPDSGPLEHYSEELQDYDGVIPRLFRAFSLDSGYDIRYYMPGQDDMRDEHLKNNQVDILSGYAPGEAPKAEYMAAGEAGETGENTDTGEAGEAGEAMETAGALEGAADTKAVQGASTNTTLDQAGIEPLTIFDAVYDGQEVSYCIYFTPTAPQELKAELTAYIDSVTPQEINGLLMETAASAPQSNAGMLITVSLGIIAAIFLAALIIAVRRYKNKLKSALRDAESDDVTGLGNQDYLVRYYRQFVNDKNRVLYRMFYFYVDTDRLRRTAGSHETDEFLKYCAVILSEYTGDTDILARVSDHGFALLRLTGSSSDTEKWLGVLLERIKLYTKLYSKPYDVHIRAGIYPLKAGDRDLDEILANACQSAYVAERMDKDYEICSDQMLQDFIREKQLQANIEQAFSRREFQLYIQFYVDSKSLSIVGGEALSRWNHPQRGVLMPGVFVPLMEREKMIGRLDYYCLEEVCEFLQDIFDRHVENIFLSCNFSRETFAAPDFVQRAREIIDRYTFPRELLIFEITESVSVKNVSQIQQNILEMRKYGVRIALDDFGEGFTSFYDLQKYSMDGIKLDKGLIDQVLTPTGSSILRAMIQVGHELGMTILAEGVETDEQVQALRSMQCDVIQGFRFYYPLPDWEAKTKIYETAGI